MLMPSVRLWLLPLTMIAACDGMDAAWVDRLWVDGQERIMEAGMSSLVLATGSHKLTFRIAPPAGVTNQAVRLRHLLAGFDAGWQDSGGGMRVALRFHNAANDVVDYRDYHVLGDSEGWTGDIATSRFRSRRETVTVPPEAVTLTLLLVSGGPCTAVGTLIIDDLTVRIAKPDAPERWRTWLNEDFERGEGLDRPEGTPRGWQRAGLRRDLLKVVTRGGNHALAARDDQPRAFGEWCHDEALAGQVAAGDILALEWQEMFSIGDGSAYTRTYEVVPPGRHVLSVATIPPFNDGPARVSSLVIDVPWPLWQRWWFLAAVLGGGAAVLALVVRHLTRVRMQRRLERLQWQQAVERERARIARDMHDDLGAGLTRIALLGTSVRGQMEGPAQAVAAIDELRATVGQLVGALDEIVWAVNPRHDTLDSLAAYLGKYAQDFLARAGLRCRLDLPFDLPEWPLAAALRHSLFLAFKEALTNVVKHARAHEVHVTLEILPQGFALVVKDDGQGFPPGGASASGNGLANMCHRLTEQGGCCRMSGPAGVGVTVRFEVQAGRGPSMTDPVPGDPGGGGRT